MRLVFAGTPDFALASLEALLDAGHDVVAVYTQPDRPSGRGRRPRASPVKQCALERGAPVVQPTTLRDAQAQHGLAAWGAELLVVAAYGLILPRAVLETPPRGCVNVHASLLPRWRGAAPIQRAILAGDRVSGVSIMQMDVGLDTGPVLARAECELAPGETGGSLHDRLATLGAGTLVEVLASLESGALPAEPQDDRLATYAERLTKEEAGIVWTEPAGAIERMVRAFDPWPVAHTGVPGLDGRLRVWQARGVAVTAAGAAPGEVLGRDADGLRVATGEGTLLITAVQAPGGRRMPATAYLNAHPVAPGTRLGP